MNYHRFYLLSFLCLPILFACENSQTFDEAAEREKILAIQQLERKYHVEEMAKEFIGLMSDNFISVNRGEITTPSRVDNEKRFSAYLDAVEFEKWDDVSPPVIRFSDDHSMAYSIIDKEVIVTYENEENQQVRGTTRFCWMAIYKKYGDEWKIDAVSSTNKPSVTQAIDNS